MSVCDTKYINEDKIKKEEYRKIANLEVDAVKRQQRVQFDLARSVRIADIDYSDTELTYSKVKECESYTHTISGKHINKINVLADTVYISEFEFVYLLDMCINILNTIIRSKGTAYYRVLLLNIEDISLEDLDLFDLLYLDIKKVDIEEIQNSYHKKGLGTVNANTFNTLMDILNKYIIICNANNLTRNGVSVCNTTVKLTNNLKLLCNINNISYTSTLTNLKSGENIYNILHTAGVSYKTHKDHLGNEFLFVDDLCNFYNIDMAYYKHLQECNKGLDYVFGSSCATPCALPDGTVFESLSDLLNHTNMSYTTLKDMLSEYKSLGQIFDTVKPKKKSDYIALLSSRMYIDHLGNHFTNLDSMLKYWGYSLTDYKRVLRLGYTPQEVVSRPYYFYCTDHLGVHFNSVYSKLKYYDVSADDYEFRLNKGLSEGEILCAGRNITQDHLGNHFKNIGGKCKYYNVKHCAYTRRLKLGYTEEEALLGKDKSIKDSFGVTHDNVSALCEYYNITEYYYKHHTELGESLQEILDYYSNRVVKDHLGQEFDSQIEMCDYWGVDVGNFRSRLRYGFSIKDALFGKSNTVQDHLGNEFNNRAEMCMYYKVKERTLIVRMKNGATLEEALTRPDTYAKQEISVDHLGNKYLDVFELCAAYNLYVDAFLVRLNKGWSLEKALTDKMRKIR